MELTLTTFSNTVCRVTFFTYGSVLYEALIYMDLNVLYHDDQKFAVYAFFHIYFTLKAKMLFAGLDLLTNYSILKVLCKEAVYIHDHFLILTTTPCRCY